MLIQAALPLTTSDTKTVSEWISQMATLPQASNLATRILLLTLLFEVGWGGLLGGGVVGGWFLGPSRHMGWLSHHLGWLSHHFYCFLATFGAFLPFFFVDFLPLLGLSRHVFGGFPTIFGVFPSFGEVFSPFLVLSCCFWCYPTVFTGFPAV